MSGLKIPEIGMAMTGPKYPYLSHWYAMAVLVTP